MEPRYVFEPGPGCYKEKRCFNWYIK
jgi:hypothetical protein